MGGESDGNQVEDPNADGHGDGNGDNPVDFVHKITRNANAHRTKSAWIQGALVLASSYREVGRTWGAVGALRSSLRAKSGQWSDKKPGKKKGVPS